MTSQQLIQAAVTGVMVGLVVWGLSLLVDMYILQPLLCQGEDGSQCGATLNYAGVIASLIGLGVGVSGLVYFRVFRPLLVGLAAMITLWGLTAMTVGWAWYLAGLAILALYAITYSLYAWVARLQAFWLAVLISLVLIVATRLVLVG